MSKIAKGGCLGMIAIFIISTLATVIIPIMVKSGVKMPSFVDDLFFLAIVGGIGYLVYKKVKARKNLTDSSERKITPDKLSFVLKGLDKDIVINNPFRGILILGGAGAGKSKSIIEPIIYQAIEKGFSGILYDFKYPALSEEINNAFKRSNSVVKPYYINFDELDSTSRINPLLPSLLPSVSYAQEYSSAIMANLVPESIQKPDFWTRSAGAYLSAVIWFLKEEHPNYCTLPHVVNLIASSTSDVVNMLCTNSECQGMVASLKESIDKKADAQTAGVVSTLQIALSKINTKEITFVLTGNDFDLNINDPANPKFLCLGNNPSLSDTYSPVISLIITASLKLMNQQRKHHSIIIMDEGPTIYVPKFDQIPATARSNKLCSLFSAQDLSQIIDNYGQTKSDVILANLNNQFFGRVAHQKTAEYISKLFGKEDRVFASTSTNAGESEKGLITFFPTISRGESTTNSIQQRDKVEIQRITSLQTGEFYGNVVESSVDDFKVRVKIQDYGNPLPIVKGQHITPEELKRNFSQVQADVKSILSQYSNSISSNKPNQSDNSQTTDEWSI